MDDQKNSIKCMNCNSTKSRLLTGTKRIEERSPITKSILRHWVSPHVLNENDTICYNCWNAADRAKEKILSQNSHLNVEEIANSELTKLDKRPFCMMCGRSTLRYQTKSIYFSSPTEEEKIITSRINSLILAHRKIEPDSMLCHACWQKVKRYTSESSGKKKKYDRNKADEAMTQHITLEHAYADPNTIELPHRMSTRRKTDDQNNGDVVKSEPDSQTKPVTKKCATTDLNSIELPQYKKISQTEDHCIFPECTNLNLRTVSNHLQVRTLKEYDIFIPRNSTICETHLNSNNWNNLYKDKVNVSTFTADDIEQIFSLVQTKANTDVNFKNYMTIDEHTFIYFLGVNRETVNVILKYLPQIEDVDNGVLGLIGLFIKHENGGPNDRIANLLKLPLESLQTAMEHVKEVLVNNPDVTKNMGIEYLLKRHL